MLDYHSRFPAPVSALLSGSQKRLSSAMRCCSVATTTCLAKRHGGCLSVEASRVELIGLGEGDMRDIMALSIFHSQVG
jgi:hypothetical protein